MISSVPLITPRDAHSLWYTPSRSFALTTPSTVSSSFCSLGASQNPNSSDLSQGRQNQNQPKRNHISPLAQLALDEQSVEQRKLHIQRFGATWIRPPGFNKTLQGELDERAERAEAERLALLEEQAVGDEDIPEVEGDEDAGVRVVGNIIQGVDDEDGEDLDTQIPEGENFEGDGGEGTEDEEVDLDGEIPEAEADYDLSDEEDSEDSDDTEEPNAATPNQYMPMPMPSSSVGRTDSSPRQAIFSHDDRFGQVGRADLREYSRRYQSEVMSEDDDEMEVDSDS